MEAVPELEKVFGQARRRLDLFRFYDNPGEEELFALVLASDEDYERVADLMRQFRKDTFLIFPEKFTPI